MLKECADVAKAFDCFDEKLRDECYANYSIKNPDCEEEEREEVRASISNEMRERLREANGGGSLLLAGSDSLSINKIEEILKGKKTKGSEASRTHDALIGGEVGVVLVAAEGKGRHRAEPLR